MPIVSSKTSQVVLSTISARSKLGRNVIFFCLEKFSGCYKSSAFYFFLTATAWSCGRWLRTYSTVEVCKYELQTFERGQKQLMCQPTRKRPAVGEILASFVQQSDFWSRRSPYRVGSVSTRAFLCMSPLYLSIVPGAPTCKLFLNGPVQVIPKFSICLDHVTINQRALELSIARVQDTMSNPFFSQPY